MLDSLISKDTLYSLVSLSNPTLFVLRVLLTYKIPLPSLF